MTTSPRPTPRAASAPASRCERSASSPKPISLRSPSREMQTSAVRPGRPRRLCRRRSSRPAFRQPSRVQRSPRAQPLEPDPGEVHDHLDGLLARDLGVLGPPVGDRLDGADEHLGEHADRRLGLVLVPASARRGPARSAPRRPRSPARRCGRGRPRSRGRTTSRKRIRQASRRSSTNAKKASRPVASRAAPDSTSTPASADASRSKSSFAFCSSRSAVEALLGVEVLVDERLRDAGLAGDVVDRRRVVAARREDGQRGVEDAGAALLGREPSSCRW